MPPMDSSESNWFSLFNRLSYKVKQWIRQEIVDDDPWDEDPFFLEPIDPPPASKTTEAAETADPPEQSPE